MTTLPFGISIVDIAPVLAGGAVGVAIGIAYVRRHRMRAPVRRIMLPFTGRSISRRALDAALRLAVAENASLMPAYLAIVPMRLALDAPLPRQAGVALPLMEAIEQRAADEGVAVDSRIECGRTYRHALQRLLESESFDRVVVPASAVGEGSFSPEDLAWLLDKAAVEVVILRPAPGDRRVISANGARRAPTRARAPQGSPAAREQGPARVAGLRQRSGIPLPGRS